MEGCDSDKISEVKEKLSVFLIAEQFSVGENGLACSFLAAIEEACRSRIKGPDCFDGEDGRLLV